MYTLKFKNTFITEYKIHTRYRENKKQAIYYNVCTYACGEPLVQRRVDKEPRENKRPHRSAYTLVFYNEFILSWGFLIKM